jgi:hypothetical protein
MHLKKLSFLAAATVLVAACGSSTTPDQLQASVPDYEGLSLEATGAASEDSALTDSAPRPALTSDGLEFLPAIQTAIHDLNQGVKQFFQPIGELIATQGTDITVGTSKTYGPLDRDGVTYLLTVKHFAPNRFAWKLEGKPSGAAASVPFTKLAVGTVFHAETDRAHRGRGQIGIDLDAFKTVKPDFAGQGKLYGAYSHYDSDPSSPAGDSKTLVYLLSNFTLDATVNAPVSAAFAGHKTPSGIRGVRVLFYGDLPAFVGTPDHAEFLLGRARFKPGVGGRADALVTAGDVPAGTFIYGAECWDRAEMLAWKKVWSCTSLDPSSCTPVSQSGDVMACDVDLRTDAPQAPTTDDDLSPEAGAPDPTVAAPTGMPSFESP